MRRYLLTWNFICVFTAIAIGQTNRFDIGIETGPSVIFFWGNEYDLNYEDPTVGFSTGLAFRYNFPKYFSIGTNVSFERKGSYSEPNSELPETGGIEIIRRHDYLTIPILVRFTVGKKVRFFVNAGPYLGYLIKQTNKVSNESGLLGIYEFTDRFKRMDFGVSTGVGLGIPIKNIVVISLEVRNNTGFNDINNSSNPYITTRKTNSNNFLIGVTYMFGRRLE